MSGSGTGPLTEEEIAGLYLASAPIQGCTNTEACNFNSEADLDDGSCSYLDACGECGGEGISGCTDSDACNFNTDAACDDDGCIYPEPLFLIDELVLCDTIATLDGGGDFEEYLWSTGETTSSIQIFESGLYTVQRSSNPVNLGSLQFGGSGLGVAIEPIQSGVLEPGGRPQWLFPIQASVVCLLEHIKPTPSCFGSRSMM